MGPLTYLPLDFDNRIPVYSAATFGNILHETIVDGPKTSLRRIQTDPETLAASQSVRD